MRAINEVQRRCIASARAHLREIWEDLCCSAGPLPTVENQSSVNKILCDAWDKIAKL